MWYYVCLSSLAGVLIPLQSLINARLGTYINGPVFAALANFTVGTSALLVFLCLARRAPPGLTQMTAAPLWAWAGGIFGAYFVWAAAISVPKLGAAAMIAIFIAAQMVSSLVLDHYGVLHAVKPVTPARLLGAALLVAGAFLILRPTE